MASAENIQGIRRGIAIGIIALSAWNALTWFREEPGVSAVIGAVVGGLFLLKYLRDDASTGVVVGLYFFLAFFGLMQAANTGNDGVTGTHLAWAFLVGVGMLMRRVLGSSVGGAVKWDQKRAGKKADASRVEANRRAQLEYAERIDREQNFQEHATRPGRMTGYEPGELVGIDLVALRPTLMFGDPGAGLAGAGFDPAAVKRGQEGEVNFAKALAKTGMLQKFATFWSVHMPDEALGASEQFATDIDCVIVTGKTVWLLDMKNYNQGDVTWKSEVNSDTSGKAEHFLIAVDNVTSGLVGPKRKMSYNMKLATDRFTQRFADNGVRYNVKSAVVLMPRKDGMGEARGVQWAGGIATVGVQDVLQWLSKEPPFNHKHRDANLLMAMLRPLLKDETGSAPKPGQIRKAARTATPPPATLPPATLPPANVAPTASAGPPTAPPIAAPPAPDAPPVTAGAVPTSVDAQTATGKVCTDCGAVIQPDWSFCFECGASL